MPAAPPARSANDYVLFTSVVDIQLFKCDFMLFEIIILLKIIRLGIVPKEWTFFE